MKFSWYISFIKLLFVNFCIIYTFFKITNQRVDKISLKIVLIFFNILFAMTYSIVRNYLEISLLYPIYYLLYAFFLSIVINIDFLYVVTIVMISSSFSIIAIVIASIISFFLMKILSLDIMEYNIIEYSVIGVIQFSLLYYFFKIKRFKNGFSFFKNGINMRLMKVIGILISLITIIISIVITIEENTLIERILFIAIALATIFTIYWIRYSITKYYKDKMKDRTVEIQEEQLKEKDEIISNLKLELSNVLEINHKYNRRLSAMERAVANLGNKLSFNEEFANEYSDVLDSLQNLSKEYKQEFDNYYILPKTNIFSVDNLLEYMKIEALKNNIEFELEINCEISEMVQKYISKNKLETLLGDHITDAIIAINSSDSASRKIKVIMGKTKEFYQIRILDTGIEFEIETLLKLGLERTTTHRDSGGTGIGFMTTFETLKECNASLVIEEYNNEKDYKKSLNIIFDGKSEYNINSYRAEKIKLQNKNNRINIKKAI